MWKIKCLVMVRSTAPFLLSLAEVWEGEGG